jgi:hypothetical protein
MNLPQSGFAPQPQQQWGHQPQAPQQPQQFAPPQQFAQPNLGAAAGANLFNQFLAEPVRQRANRAKPADGTYVVRFTPGCKMDFSQKNANPYLLLEYQVIESSVPQMNGQVFSIPVFWANRFQMQDLADLAKYVFGANLQQVAAQTNGNPQMMAQFICQTVMQGLFAGLRVHRTQKQVQSVGYEQAFANHNWVAVAQQPMTLAQLGASLGPAQQPQQSFMPQQPMQQAPQQFAPQPQAPQQPQQFAPQQAFQQAFPTQPQQPAFPAPQQYAPQPQALPQAAPALPQAQPQQQAPAFYVPGAQPPR